MTDRPDPADAVDALREVETKIAHAAVGLTRILNAGAVDTARRPDLDRALALFEAGARFVAIVADRTEADRSPRRKVVGTANLTLVSSGDGGA